MHFFNYRGRRLYAEGVSIERIAKEVGTPVYIYSHKTLKRHYNAFTSAFRDVSHLVCYSVKANSNLSVLRVFSEEGSGFDIEEDPHVQRGIPAGIEAY